MEDNKDILKLPYYLVEYYDDEGRRHLATIEDKSYVDFLRTRFDIIMVKIIDK